MARTAALHSLGCKVNSYETEVMRQALSDGGYEIVPFAPGADVYVINTCSVTNIADRKSRQMLHRAKKMNPDAVVVAVGCYAQLRGGELVQDEAVDLILGTEEKDLLVERLREFCHSREESVPGAIARERTRAFLKIEDGCDHFCSYCIIPYARGRVRSRDVDEVLAEARSLANAGTMEIVLTGIHICSYGKDRADGPDLTQLVCRIHDAARPARIRLGSLEPSYITEDAVRVLATLPGLCPHFHLSLQSGCDRTLSRMNRRYTTEEYAGKVELLRRYFSAPAITTDIITGFPGETEEEFRETCAFVREIGFFETHIFPYSRREGTRAANMPGQLTEKEKKERSRVLLEMNARQSEAFLQQFKGEKIETLFEEEVTIDGRRYWTGLGPAYQRVLMQGGEDLRGKLLSVTGHAVRDGALLA